MHKTGIILQKEAAMIADSLNLVKFDDENWARTTSEAGIKYIVITAKHCDGFAMFNSETRHYNIVVKSDVLSIRSSDCFM